MGTRHAPGRGQRAVRSPLTAAAGGWRRAVAVSGRQARPRCNRPRLSSPDRAVYAVRVQPLCVGGGQARAEKGRRAQRRERGSPPPSHRAHGNAASRCTTGPHRFGPAPSQSRHDRVLRQGRYRVAETGGPALAGGAVMRHAVDRYLAMRQAAGFALVNAAFLLHSFARAAAERGETHVRAATAIEWASRDPSVAQRDARLKTICRFARYVQPEDGRHDVPPAKHFGTHKIRRVPHIYSRAEITRLIDAARQLGPPEEL